MPYGVATVQEDREMFLFLFEHCSRADEFSWWWVAYNDLALRMWLSQFPKPPR